MTTSPDPAREAALEVAYQYGVVRKDTHPDRINLVFDAYDQARAQAGEMPGDVASALDRAGHAREINPDLLAQDIRDLVAQEVRWREWCRKWQQETETLVARLAAVERQATIREEVFHDEMDEVEGKLKVVIAERDALRKLVNEQAEDEGLWFEAYRPTEEYLQKELRRLHAAIKDKSPEECAKAALNPTAPADGEG